MNSCGRLWAMKKPLLDLWFDRSGCCKQSLDSWLFSQILQNPFPKTHKFSQILIIIHQILLSFPKIFKSADMGFKVSDLGLLIDLSEGFLQLEVIVTLKPLLATERLKTKRKSWKGKQNFLVIYSSIFGGIITDPSAMVIPMDDHIIHRGHGVFDTAAIFDGQRRSRGSGSSTTN